MKVFISWSGDRSRAVAELLRRWLKCVVQAIQPWMSTHDIDRGALWISKINEELKDISTGILCLTKENLNRPWILFEAGALAKGLTSARVCTLLVDLKPADIEDPLAQFNHTLPNREGIRALLETLNSALGAEALEKETLDSAFEAYWPRFEKEFAECLQVSSATEGESRDDREILAEVLDHSRSTVQRLAALESMFPSHREQEAIRAHLEMTVREATTRIVQLEEMARMKAMETTRSEAAKRVAARIAGMTLET
jgi:hypothetical protein